MKKLFLSSFLLVICILTTAQSANIATGGNATGTGGSVSYSAGQVAYTTNTGTTGTISQGIQQPYEISVATGSEEARVIDLICSAYPNPASDFLTLKTENYANENLSYMLSSANGTILVSKKVNGSETIISMENLVPSVYYLVILYGNKEIKTFKIIKK